jgi:hypothetical protein
MSIVQIISRDGKRVVDGGKSQTINNATEDASDCDCCPGCGNDCSVECDDPISITVSGVSVCDPEEFPPVDCCHNDPGTLINGSYSLDLIDFCNYRDQGSGFDWRLNCVTDGSDKSWYLSYYDGLNIRVHTNNFGTNNNCPPTGTYTLYRNNVSSCTGTAADGQVVIS